MIMEKQMSEEVVAEGKKFISEYNKCPSPEKIGDMYDAVSPEGYDAYTQLIKFNAEQTQVCDAISKSVEDGGLGVPSDSKILDVGCGTGILYKFLKERGYENMDGIDASKNFVESNNKNGIYKNCDFLYMGQGDDKYPEKFHGVYDAVIGSGVFIPHHMPCECFDDVYTSLKMGGYFCTAIRSSVWKEGHEIGYYDYMQKLIKAGKFELYKSHEFERGCDEGDVEYFHKQMSTLVVFKKIA